MSDQTLKRVARLQDLPNEEITAVAIEGREIALYRIGSEVFATDNCCTHGAARLSDGFLDGYAIECPLHQAVFDVRTGAVNRAPAERPIRTYPVEIDDQDVYITFKGLNE